MPRCRRNAPACWSCQGLLSDVTGHGRVTSRPADLRATRTRKGCSLLHPARADLWPPSQAHAYALIVTTPSYAAVQPGTDLGRHARALRRVHDAVLGGVRPAEQPRAL